MTRAELFALANRVEAATGPDRELDAEIARLCGAIIPWHHIGRDVAEWHDPRGVLTGSMTTSGRYVPFYTLSIDAAASLQIPGWSQSVWNRSDGISEAHVERDSPPSEAWGATSGMTPDAMARALTAAWLRARTEEAGE